VGKRRLDKHVISWISTARATRTARRVRDLRTGAEKKRAASPLLCTVTSPTSSDPVPAVHDRKAYPTRPHLFESFFRKVPSLRVFLG